MTRWCDLCGIHEVDDPRRGATCPVCTDQAVKAAEARVAAMWADITKEAG